mgnify:CR=1 FL=1
MPVERPGRVYGTIVDDVERPLAGVRITVAQKNQTLRAQLNEVTWRDIEMTTGPKGAFAFDRLIPDDEVRLRAVGTGIADVESEPFTVASGETHSIQIRAQRAEPRSRRR